MNSLPSPSEIIWSCVHWILIKACIWNITYFFCSLLDFRMFSALDQLYVYYSAGFWVFGTVGLHYVCNFVEFWVFGTVGQHSIYKIFCLVYLFHASSDMNNETYLYIFNKVYNGTYFIYMKSYNVLCFWYDMKYYIGSYFIHIFVAYETQGFDVCLIL